MKERVGEDQDGKLWSWLVSDKGHVEPEEWARAAAAWKDPSPNPPALQRGRAESALPWLHAGHRHSSLLWLGASSCLCVHFVLAKRKAEAPLLSPPDMRSWLIGKDPDAGKDWKQEGKRVTEDVRVGWHPWLNGHEFEQSPGEGEGKGSLACCSPWTCKETRLSDWTTTKQKLWEADN